MTLFSRILTPFPLFERPQEVDNGPPVPPDVAALTDGRFETPRLDPDVYWRCLQQFEKLEKLKHKVDHKRNDLLQYGFSIEVEYSRRLTAKAERDHRIAAELFSRTNFGGNPASLKNYLAEWQNADPDRRANILRQYLSLLSALFDPTLRYRPTVDFHAIPPEARPYLVGPYVGLHTAHGYPFLSLEDSDLAAGNYTYIVNGVADPVHWQAHLPAISKWLESDVTITDATATTITLTLRAPLEEQVDFNPEWLNPGHIFLGLDVAARLPLQIRLADLSHTLLTGTVGMGKSVAMASIIQSLLHSEAWLDHVYCVDPGGIAFNRYRGVSPKLTTLSTAEDFATLAQGLLALMAEREAELGNTGREKFTDRFVCVVVDEFPAYATPDGTDKASKDAHQAFMKNIVALAKRGRKSGIRLILTVQTPTENDIPPNLRSVLPGILAFRTPVQAHAQQLFGEIVSLPADPRTLQRGRAIYRDGTTGTTTQVQFPLITVQGREHGAQ